MSFQIFVRNLLGKPMPLEASPALTILGLKHLIHENEGIPVRNQRVLFRGKDLDDGMSLADSQIVPDSQLSVSLRLLGGGFMAAAIVAVGGTAMAAAGTVLGGPAVGVTMLEATAQATAVAAAVPSP